MRVSNVYFLITAILCSFKSFSPLPSYTAWLPLGFVLCVSLLREAFEDIVSLLSVNYGYRNAEWMTTSRTSKSADSSGKKSPWFLLVSSLSNLRNPISRVYSLSVYGKMWDAATWFSWRRMNSSLLILCYSYPHRKMETASCRLRVWTGKEPSSTSNAWCRWLTQYSEKKGYRILN